MKYTIKYTETYEMYYEVEAESEIAAQALFNELSTEEPDFFHDMEMVDSNIEVEEV